MSPLPNTVLQAPLVPIRPEYSPEERRILLVHARQAIGRAFAHEHLDLTPPSDHLAEKRGVFTTLHEHGELRGCVGYVFPTHSLYRSVAETAVGAAFNDTRFHPLHEAELPALNVEISILSRLFPIEPEEIEIGRHGLLVSQGSRRGLLLPQVASDRGWDRETFLSQTCLKAGLPADEWHHGVTLDAFTTEIFHEN